MSTLNVLHFKAHCPSIYKPNTTSFSILLFFSFNLFIALFWHPVQSLLMVFVPSITFTKHQQTILYLSYSHPVRNPCKPLPQQTIFFVYVTISSFQNNLNALVYLFLAASSAIKLSNSFVSLIPNLYISLRSCCTCSALPSREKTFIAK